MSSEIDLSQFHSIFFEECTEGIEIMETGLLALEIGNPDPEMINKIFRAAHSIKGGAGTFGFGEISNFTHTMETLLDEMRDGRAVLTQEIVEVLLECVDYLRTLMKCSKDGEQVNKGEIIDLQKKLAAFSNVAQVSETSADTEQSRVTGEDSGWLISFFPYENLFYTGNDPFRIIRELETMGNLTVTANLENLPDFTDLNPESCYLGWEMQLDGDIELERIKDVFAWVEDDCRLEIKPKIERRKRKDRRGTSDEPVKYGRRMSDADKLVSSEATSIRVDIDKIDDLVNLVGELVISQSILNRVCRDMITDGNENLNRGLELLERNTRDLQDQAMRIRMLPIDFVFQRLPRLVHDLSRTLGKQVDLQFSGKSTELDKTVLEKIADPMVHLIRNALDHGLEKPEERLRIGKNEVGTIHVSAYHEGGNIIIKITDDGAGLNLEKILAKARQNEIVRDDEELSEQHIQDLIFQPGFSTATEVSDVSGRGVGMDVVRRNISDLGGTVEVESVTGKGSTFTIKLPLTLAIMEGQMVRVGNQVYIIPLLSIIESIQINSSHLNAITGKAELYRYRDEYISVINLYKLFGIKEETTDHTQGLLVIVQSGLNRVGLYIKEVLGQQQVVIKSLEKNFQHVRGIAAATILGDGSVALILDIQGLVQHYTNQDMN